MSTPFIFNVLTEFRFEIGSALLGSRQLTEAVHGLSSAADQALGSFQHLAVGIGAQMGLGAGGVAGSLYTAIKTADKFRTSQIALANIMNSQGSTFEERMMASEKIIGKVNKIASEFALPADDLLMMTKVLAPMLQSKGLGGQGFSNAIDLSRGLLKSAPTLGVDPGLVQGQMLRMIEGGASMGDTLFTRLISDTQAMGKFKDSKSFNALNEKDRFEVVKKALSEFSSDTKVLSANVMTLNGQMNMLKNSITGVSSVLVPIGRVINSMIIPALMQFNTYLDVQGRQILNSVARFIEPFMKDWKFFIANLMQARSIFSDLKSIGSLYSTVGMILGLGSALKFFGLEIPVVTKAINGLHTVLEFMGKNRVFAGGGLLNGIFGFISRLVAPFMLLFGVLQLLSRAAAYGKMEFFERLAMFMPRITEAFAVLSRTFGVFLEGFDNIARSLGSLFDPSQFLGLDLLEGFTDVLEILSTGLGFATSTLYGFMFAIMEFGSQLTSFFTGGGFNFSAIGDAFTTGTEDMFERIFGNANSGDAIVSNVVNIAKVEQSFQFKEQMEPDRVAFTVKEQLLKAATNPTQGRSQRPFSFGASGTF